jgi:hypothetical protein
VFGQVLDDFRYRFKDVFKPNIVETALFGVGLRQSQRSQQYFVVISSSRIFRQESPSLLDCLDRITRQHPLVGGLLRRQRGLIPQHNIDKLKAFDMACKDHEA